MRHLIGAFNEVDWKKLYKQAYDNLAPGSWIEHCITFHPPENLRMKPLGIRPWCQIKPRGLERIVPADSGVLVGCWWI